MIAQRVFPWMVTHGSLRLAACWWVVTIIYVLYVCFIVWGGLLSNPYAHLPVLCDFRATFYNFE